MIKVLTLGEKRPPGGLSSTSSSLWLGPNASVSRLGRTDSPSVLASCGGSRLEQLIPLFYGAGGGALRTNNRLLSLGKSANAPGDCPTGQRCAALVTEINK